MASSPTVSSESALCEDLVSIEAAVEQRIGFHEADLGDARIAFLHQSSILEPAEHVRAYDKVMVVSHVLRSNGLVAKGHAVEYLDAPRRAPRRDQARVRRELEVEIHFADLFDSLDGIRRKVERFIQGLCVILQVGLVAGANASRQRDADVVTLEETTVKGLEAQKVNRCVTGEQYLEFAVASGGCRVMFQGRNLRG